MPTTFVLVFLGWLRPQHPVALSFWTFFSHPSLRSSWPCWVGGCEVPFARSSSCILSRRSCELTWPLVVTPHIQQIIARSLRCRRYRSDKVGAQVSLAGAWRSWRTNCKLFHWRWWKWAGGKDGQELVEFVPRDTVSCDRSEFTAVIWGRISSPRSNRRKAPHQASPDSLWLLLLVCHLLVWPV